MYAQAAIKPNSLLRNGAYGIVMRGVQKCTRGCSSLRGRKRLPLCCIKLDTATDLDCGMGNILVGSMRAAGMGAQQTQDNGADSLYHVKCGMGNVTITFK